MTVTDSRADQAAGPGQGIGAGQESGMGTLRTGLRLTPEFHRGIGVTLLLALIATAGRIVVPLP